MSHLIIQKVSLNGVARIEDCTVTITEEPDVLAGDFETYFCANGHDFLFGFNLDSVEYVPVMFECPDCTAVAVNNPFAFEQKNKQSESTNLEEKILVTV